MEDVISEMPPPPPYSSQLPTYDEISQSLPALQTVATSVTDQTITSSQADSTLLPPAPPAYDDIMQHQTMGGQPYNTPVQQQQQPVTNETSRTAHPRTDPFRQQGRSNTQPATMPNQYAYHNTMQHPPTATQSPVNVQTNVESGETLQQRIERRMAAIDEQLRQRQTRIYRTPRTEYSRTNAYRQQGIRHAQPVTVPNQYAYRSNQPHHNNTVQHPPTAAQSPAVNEQQNQTNVEMYEFDRSLQQRIARRMAAIDAQTHQRQAGRTLETSRSEYPRSEYPRTAYPRTEYPRTVYPRIVYSRTDAYHQQGSPDTQPAIIPNQHTYRSNQHHHNTIQHPPTAAQSSVNEQQNQTDVEISESGEEGLQQRITRRMAAIDEEIHQRRAGKMPARRTSQASVRDRHLPTQIVTNAQSATHQRSQVPSQAPLQPSSQVPSQAPLQPSSHVPSQAPLQPSSQVPSQAPLQPSSQVPSQAPLQASSQAPLQASSQAPSHNNTRQQQDQSVINTPLQQSSTAVNSESGLPQRSNINAEEEDLQLRLEQRFAAIDNSIQRSRAMQKNQKKDGCFCFSFLHL